MQQLFSFALIGIGIGALYAICAQGVVLIYRGSGVVNFGQSGFVIVGGYTCYQLQQIAWMPTWLSVVGAVAAGAIVSAATYYLVMRPMKQSSPLARVVATLGVQVILVSAAEIKYGENVLSVHSFLPTSFPSTSAAAWSRWTSSSCSSSASCSPGCCGGSTAPPRSAASPPRSRRTSWPPAASCGRSRRTRSPGSTGSSAARWPA